jgi:glycosyltransferase involved in cell wall biosynthesis
MTPAASAKPRIVIVTHEFAPFRGGVATYSAELAAAFHRAGQTVEVWAPDYGAHGVREDVVFPVVRLRAGGSLRFWDMVQFARQLVARRAQLESTTVLLTSVGAHMAFMILLPLGRIKCGRVLSLLHGSEVLRFERNPFWKFWARRFFPRVECVLTVSQFSRSLIERSFLSSLIRQMVMAPCACSTAAMQMSPVMKPSDGKIRVLTLARVHPRKGQLDTAQALALLPPELRAKVVYQIGGKGDVEYLRRVEQACHNGSVAFDNLGEITDTLAGAYQQCDIFAMTSRTLPKSVEGFGIAYLDAGFHGKPVVGYRSGGATEAVVDGETGLLIEQGDVAALATALQQLMTDPALRERLGAGGRRYAASFSWDATARIIEAVLKKAT